MVSDEILDHSGLMMLIMLTGDKGLLRSLCILAPNSPRSHLRMPLFLIVIPLPMESTFRIGEFMVRSNRGFK